MLTQSDIPHTPDPVGNGLGREPRIICPPSAVQRLSLGRPSHAAVVIRHELNGELAVEDGGHIGYHVVAPWRRQGCHADAGGRIGEVPGAGSGPVLLCCSPDNEGSRRVILKNAGQPDSLGTAKTGSGPP